jgi:acetolactate synthase I/II/III large subunit
MIIASYIAHFLKGKGIDTVFELQGGMITRMIDELNKVGGFNIVSMHHEQAAAFAADAYARITGKPGVAMGTSGPGATNLITGIGGCYFDSVPAIFITGQVNLNEQKGVKETRQIGFQETDIVSIIRPITKAAWSVKKATDIPEILDEAWKISLEGRPGPVLIDIPMNLQNEEIVKPDVVNSNPDTAISDSEIQTFIDNFIDLLGKSKRPLVLVGHGVRLANATDRFLKFVEKHDLPVVCSLLGLDNIPFNHPNRIGFIGTYGNRWANYALGTCDLLLVMGSRLDLRQTGSDLDSFRIDKTIFHVDIDSAELNNRISDCNILNLDVAYFLNLVLQSEKINSDIKDWYKELEQKKQKFPDTKELINPKGINPNIFIHLLSEYSKKAKVITTDVGNNQMWTAQSIELDTEQRFLSSGGMGAMGYSLPAAIGASFALNKETVVSISGDGGFQINIQELETIKRNNLPVKMVIINNHCLGMIRQFQDAYFDSCYKSTVDGYSSPDFEKVAKAYGIDSVTISSPEEIEYGLKCLWKHPNKPFLLNVSIDIHTNVYPKMMFGSPMTQMEP